MMVSTVVLAGGQASRMGGVDKGLVTFKDKKMVQWTLDVVAPLSSQLIISCNRNMSDYVALADSVVCDRIAGFLGPLAGIHAAMESASESALLVLPCDTPLINKHIISKLLDAAQKHPEAIIFLTQGKFAHPLHAVIPLKFKANLETYLIDGGRGVRKWYMQHDVVEIAVSDKEGEALVNINTLQELEDSN
jgi:molybdopterin-guanine dinucleotide biosynthesis protein A